MSDLFEALARQAFDLRGEIIPLSHLRTKSFSVGVEERDPLQGMNLSWSELTAGERVSPMHGKEHSSGESRYPHGDADKSSSNSLMDGSQNHVVDDLQQPQGKE